MLAAAGLAEVELDAANSPLRGSKWYKPENCVPIHSTPFGSSPTDRGQRPACKADRVGSAVAPAIPEPPNRYAVKLSSAAPNRMTPLSVKAHIAPLRARN